MRYYFAPMEGITTALYRNLHHRFFPGMDQYYTPFLSPARDHVFSKRDLQEILPEHQEGVPVVPQLLTKYPEDFIWAAGELAAMGYQEVNLNLGCPSGTVAARGRGAGFLAMPDELDHFLEEIFENREQIEISKFYERIPKPVLIATQEFEDGQIYFRNPATEKKTEEKKSL